MSARRGLRGGGDIGCERAKELAPDLALGLLDGADRAAVLAHVDRCASCRAEVASLTELGDHLLLLAPEVPPPPGFESRVLAQLAPEQRQRRRRRSRRALLAVAAAVLGLAGVVTFSLARGGGGTGGGETATGAATDAGRTTTTARPGAVAELHTADGDVVGAATLHEADDGGATVELDVAEWLDHLARYGEPVEGRWSLHVEGPGGLHEMHALALEAGPARVRLDGQARDVGSVAVVDESGRAWCWGDFA